ncbi:glycosyltransferase family 39 protein [Asticcacaulis sp. BYS171W]|uniref:Glycosyltransferase family 39 protein n=1 Tax=Asticcacaulis aquaticus TaxID=2984212 RepID=A0ABT5HRZ6_9CAUL|nr:glycosyltransferase family 39 protein [Asticcacaulis aquaticus]MDC7682845.1 glycosyltransferase family 39 protein [Asticcacaulis aquaticus]
MTQLYELGQGPEPLSPQKPLFGDDRALIRAGLIIGGVIALWKLYIALTANVIWEEGHFAVSGLYPALGYPDIPAGFPLLSRLVTLIFGMNVVPLRLLSLLIASAIPFAIYFMASAVVPKREAIWAAILSLLIPPLSISGTIFYPEGLLQLLLALMLGCLLRAITEDTWKWWGLTGLCAALGLFVHFRFLIPGAGIIVYVLVTAQGRKLLTNVKFWSVGGIAALGLVPSLLYNAFNDWPAIAFHVTNRPVWRPDVQFLVAFLSQQIAMVTPIFFIGLTAAAVRVLKSERDQPVALLGVVGVFIFGFYLLQSPANAKLMPHWPFMAYVPLVAVLPGTLIRFADGARTVSGQCLRSGLIGLAPVLALAVGIGITVYEYAWTHTEKLPWQWRSINFMRNENWTALKPVLAGAEASARQRFGAEPVLAVSGHVPAVRLEFPAKAVRMVFTLDEPYDTFSRFGTARKEWGLGYADLVKTKAGKGAVLVLPEPSYLYHQPEELAFRDRLCRQFEDIQPYRIVDLPPGRTTINVYTARIRATPLGTAPARCAFLPELYIAQPPRGTFIEAGDSGNFFGIATDPLGLTRVDILIDGKVVAPANYGLDPKDFQAPKPLSYDPNWPKVQFDFKLDKAGLKPGAHVLSLRATRTDGTVVEGAPRAIYVKE